MPGRSSPPPHIDPFPPLSLLRPPNPTYASVTASSSRSPARTTEPPHNTWSTEDVDPSDRLDELNPYASGIPAPSTPPWRRNDASHTTSPRNGNPTRLTPMFTLDQLLGNPRPSPTNHPPTNSASGRLEPATVTSGAHRHYANPFTLPGYQDVWPTMNTRQERQRSWDGTIDAARQRGYVPDPARNEENQPGPMAAALRRRRDVQPYSSIPQMTVDPDEVLPAAYFGREEDDDDGNDDHPWVTRSERARLYQHENTTGDDLDGWGRNDSPGSGSLTRGRNNRRRRSLIQRREGTEERVGMEPTNSDAARGLSPLVVRSNGVRRQREQNEDEVIEGLALKLRKKRKVEANQPIDNAFFTRPAYLAYSTLDPSIPLPDQFLPPTRSSRLAITILHTPDRPPRPVITFTIIPTPRGNDTDAASLRTLTPIPIGCGIHYYEAEVLDQGEEGFMSVGWMKAGGELGRLVGWDKGSWGWHGDDGMSFEEQGAGEDFSEKWGTGDTVGCGVDFATGRAFFTKNGKFIGHRFKNLTSGLHPAIGLRTARESIAVNFSGPFSFDIDAYVRKLRDQAWTEARRAREIKDVPRLCDQTAERIPSASPVVVKTEREEIKQEQVDNFRERRRKFFPAGLSRTSPAVKVEVDEVKEEGEEKALDTLPSLSPLREPSNKAAASFVLDYLAHNGYDTALRLARDGMIRQKWLPPPTTSSAPTSSPPRIPRRRQLSDFPSLPAALVYLHDQILNADIVPIPWNLIHSLDPTCHHRSISHRLHIHSFLRLLRRADDLPEPEAELLDQEAIDLGKTLLGRSKEENWGKEERKLLNEAFGLLGIPVSEWDTGPGSVAGEERREADADELLASIRQVRGMKERSYLEQAMRQSVLVGRRVAEVDGGAGLVDVRRIWEREGKERVIDGTAGDKRPSDM